MKWTTIPLPDSLSPQAKRDGVRLNALGSLFYFNKAILNHNRLSPDFHAHLCALLEQENLQDDIEVPRDHFKTTIASVSLPMWWSLPFLDRDEELMRSLGYDDAWIRWMRIAHDTCTRTLIASEIIDNARKIGTQIRGHYESNDVFRYIFGEIKLKENSRGKWNKDSMTHTRLNEVSYHGEGTYDFIGVKGALQSRHYRRIIVDDPVGEKAIKSDTVMQDTIEWIKKLPGASDEEVTDIAKVANLLFIGNRWSQRDVGSWLRTAAPNFRFITHAATGSCGDRGCTIHRAGIPIFPEEYTMERLALIRQWEGGYTFSCQYENNPIAPEAVRFKTEWLRHYTLAPFRSANNIQIANSQQWIGESFDHTPPGAEPERNKIAIVHETRKGETLEDTRAGLLDRVLIMDPNHSGENGRSKNALLVLGYYKPQGQSLPQRIYLLDSWAKACDHSEWIDMAIGNSNQRKGLALKWRVHAVYIESRVAGQQGWEHLLREKRSRLGYDASFSIRPLKTDRAANAKHTRILSMESVFENGLLWVSRSNPESCQAFLSEYEEYPNGSSLDLLDLMGYAPQTWGPGSRWQARDFVGAELKRRQTALQQIGQAGY